MGRRAVTGRGRWNTFIPGPGSAADEFRRAAKRDVDWASGKGYVRVLTTPMERAQLKAYAKSYRLPLGATIRFLALQAMRSGEPLQWLGVDLPPKKETPD